MSKQENLIKLRERIERTTLQEFHYYTPEKPEINRPECYCAVGVVLDMAGQLKNISKPIYNASTIGALIRDGIVRMDPIEDMFGLGQEDLRELQSVNDAHGKERVLQTLHHWIADAADA
jgi:hypothetical protein